MGGQFEFWEFARSAKQGSGFGFEEAFLSAVAKSAGHITVYSLRLAEGAVGVYRKGDVVHSLGINVVGMDLAEAWMKGGPGVYRFELPNDETWLGIGNVVMARDGLGVTPNYLIRHVPSTGFLSRLAAITGS